MNVFLLVPILVYVSEEVRGEISKALRKHVCEKERERDRERETERERERELSWESELVCVCVWEREREIGETRNHASPILTFLFFTLKEANKS